MADNVVSLGGGAPFGTPLSQFGRRLLPKVMFSFNLQTLAIDKVAAVTSIGIAAFNADGVIDSRHYPLNYDEQVSNCGRVIDPGTIRYWMERSEIERTAALAGTDKRLLADDAIVALDSFVSAQLAAVREDRKVIWTTHPQFHTAIYETLVADYDCDPVPYRSWFDVATLNLLTGVGPEEFEGKNHAEMHARHQAETVIAGLKRLEII